MEKLRGKYIDFILQLKKFKFFIKKNRRCLKLNNYSPPFQITEKMTTLIGEISEEIGRISVCYKKIVNPHLRKEN